MEKKKSKGRRKIPMEKIENPDDRFASFSKRRASLYKKASKLVKECDVDIGMMIASPTGKPFSFFHPTVDAVVSRFQNPDMQLSPSTHLVACHTRNKVNQLNNRLEEFDTIEGQVISQKKLYDEVMKTRERGWWESIEQLNKEEVAEFDSWLSIVGSDMHSRLNQLENGASTSQSHFETKSKP
ncbi:hypothetical protein HAX54_049375 [Datura stramonium]|uniref:MADS-box domain-containing protein n=1 Tax=Datura stramonium TaxID=4076 RepID=A0ABS8SVG0_DATST|nr:hypothetical protein [Datura stramonium]